MNKHIIVLFAALAIWNRSGAQSVVGTVFNQNGTQKDYYLQQIAALGVYAKDLKSGYKTVTNGLNTIHDAKNGELDLHKAYFSSLANVNPVIKKDPKVNGILAYQEEISSCFSNMFATVNKASQIATDDINYMKSVYSYLMTYCNNDLDELTMVITDGKVQMKDDERIKRISKLYTDMQDKYQFAQSFTKQAIVLAVQKEHSQNDLQTLQQLYPVKH